MKETTTMHRSFKEHVQYILLWLFFIWVSCLCAILMDLLLVKIVTSIVAVSYPVEVAIHTIVYLLGTSVPLAAISYLIAYHLGGFSPAYSVIEWAGASVLLLPFGILLGFPVWITGGVKWLAGLIEYGSKLYDADTLKDVALTNYLLAFVLFAAFYLIVKIVFSYVGKSARIRNRIALTGSASNPCETATKENQ